MMYDVKTAVLEIGECYVDVSVSPILLTRSVFKKFLDDKESLDGLIFKLEEARRGK